MKNSPTLLRISEEHPHVIDSDTFKGIAEVCGALFQGEKEAIAARIVSCFNAFEGIEDPQKMRDTWDAIKHLELDAYQKCKEDLDKANEEIDRLRKELDKVTDQASELKILCYAFFPHMEQEEAEQFEAEIQAICGPTKDKTINALEQFYLPELGDSFKAIVTNNAGEEIHVTFKRTTVSSLIELSDIGKELRDALGVPIYIIDNNKRNFFGLFRGMIDSRIVIDSFNNDGSQAMVDSSECLFVAIKSSEENDRT